MRIAGSGGRVRVGYQTAASVGAWTLTRTRVSPEPEYEAALDLYAIDAFWSQQRPMDVELSVGQRVWVWSRVHPNLDAESLAVTLTGGPSIH